MAAVKPQKHLPLSFAMETVGILDACRMCEPLGIFNILIIIQVQLSLTVVRFKCNLSVHRLAFERVIKRKLESESQ